MNWRWLVGLGPLGLGLLAAWLLQQQGPAVNPTLYLRLDLGTLVALLGAGISGIGLIGLALRSRLAYVRRVSADQARRLAAADRRRFLRRLDHELKNPLMAIRAGLANLAEIAAQHHQGQGLAYLEEEVLGSIEAQTLRLSRLIGDLRKLTELEQRAPERNPVELPHLLEEALDTLREQGRLDGRQLNLTLPQAPWPLPTIPGDRDLLFLSVYNLLDNALKFTQPGDTIEVRAYEDGTTLVLEVADTGPGISPAELPHVWEELYRGEGSRHIPGSGLGLSLVRAVADLHGGEVSLRSRLGQGTVVILRLPSR